MGEVNLPRVIEPITVRSTVKMAPHGVDWAFVKPVSRRVGKGAVGPRGTAAIVGNPD